MNVLKVNIYGTDYSIKANADPEYTREVACFVDDKMREISQVTSRKSPEEVAILTALHLADEFFKQRELIKTADERIKLLVDRLDEIL